MSNSGSGNHGANGTVFRSSEYPTAAPPDGVLDGDEIERKRVIHLTGMRPSLQGRTAEYVVLRYSRAADESAWFWDHADVVLDQDVNERVAFLRDQDDVPGWVHALAVKWTPDEA